VLGDPYRKTARDAVTPWLAFRPRCPKTTKAMQRLDTQILVAEEMDRLDAMIA